MPKPRGEPGDRPCEMVAGAGIAIRIDLIQSSEGGHTSAPSDRRRGTGQDADRRRCPRGKGLKHPLHPGRIPTGFAVARTSQPHNQWSRGTGRLRCHGDELLSAETHSIVRAISQWCSRSVIQSEPQCRTWRAAFGMPSLRATHRHRRHSDSFVCANSVCVVVQTKASPSVGSGGTSAACGLRRGQAGRACSAGEPGVLTAQVCLQHAAPGHVQKP